MSMSIPPVLHRVPGSLSSSMLLGSLSRTNRQLLDVQMQMASGYRVNRMSDDPIAARAIAVLEGVVLGREQRLRNLQHADGMIAMLDQSLSEASDLLLEAKSIGLGQVGVGADADTRQAQAQVIDAMIDNLVNIANRSHQGLFLFGGTDPTTMPIQALDGGYRWAAPGGGFITDTGLGASGAVTMGADEALGMISGRIEGDHDLQPGMIDSTLLSDLGGAVGEGATPGVIELTINGQLQQVDLSAAVTVGDVMKAIRQELQLVDPSADVTIDPADSSRFQITSGGLDIQVVDQEGSSLAADLGLAGSFTPGSVTSGNDVDPALTMLTRLDACAGIDGPLGQVRISNGQQTRVIDCSGCETVQDLVELVHQQDIGVRVEISEDRTRLSFLNELSGASLSISEVDGGQTATMLGVRSLAGSTLLEDFNGGLGVQILVDGVDPVTGEPDPLADDDFLVTASDGTSFRVDLAGATTVSDALAMINQAAQEAGLDAAGFSASLADDGNGILLVDGTGGTDPFTVTSLNGSSAAEDLGILGTGQEGRILGEDRATVAVESVISHLVYLRDALLGNDERGIAFAVEQLEFDISRVAQARAHAGIRAQRITNAVVRQEDLLIQDLSMKSSMKDLDFAEAAVRFSTLQQQLQAGLTISAATSSLSLLDFLR